MNNIKPISDPYLECYQLEDGSLEIVLDMQCSITEMINHLETIKGNYPDYKITVGVFRGQFSAIVEKEDEYNDFSNY